MKILRLRAYYHPELASGLHLDDDLCDEFKKNKIVYENITPQPTRGVTKEVYNAYKKIQFEIKNDGYVIVRRFKMFREGKNPIVRALRYLLCSLVEYRLGKKVDNVDIVYSSSTPPTQGFLSAKLAKKLSKKYNKKVAFVYAIHDLFPDSLVSSGIAKKNGILWKIGEKIEKYTYEQADRIIVIGNTQKQALIRRGVPKKKIAVISNWINPELIAPVSRIDNTLFDELCVNREKYVILYAGNLGETQGVGVILDAAKKLVDDSDIQFVIFGSGVEYDKLKSRIQNEKIGNVILRGMEPSNRVSEVYSMGDLAIISCKPGAGQSALPSKTWSIMACNTPIIASFDKEGDLSNTLKKYKVGSCVKPGDAVALADEIRNQKEAKRRTSGVDSRELVLKIASKEKCVSRYIDIFKSTLNKEG